MYSQIKNKRSNDDGHKVVSGVVAKLEEGEQQLMADFELSGGQT